jgi:hypothetical protein
MRSIIAAAVGLVFGVLIGAGLATFWLVKEYQSFRYMLEDVHLTPINIENKRLGDVATELAAEIKQQKGVEVRYIFSPPNLADELPTHFTDLTGHGYFAVLGLAKTYRCEVELVGDRVILFTRSDQSSPAATQHR